MMTFRFFLAAAAFAMVFNSNLPANEHGIANKDTKFTVTVPGGFVVRKLPAGTDMEIVGEKAPGVLMIRIGQDNGTIPKDDVTLAPAPVAPQKILSKPTRSASVRGGPPSIEKDFPGEKDFATALAKAKKEKRPIFLLHGYDHGFAYNLPLRDPSIRAALDDFVWVLVSSEDQACKEFMIKNKSVAMNCLFIDPETETIIAETTGDTMMRDISVARAAAALPLTPEMQKSLLTAFEPDYAIIHEMSNAGDVDGLLAYLKPMESDALRKNGFLVLLVHLPAGISCLDAVCIVSEKSETTSSASVSKSELGSTQWLLSDSGVCVVSMRPMSGDIVETIRIRAPGCQELQAEVRHTNSTAVLSREFTLLPWPPEKMVSFEGRVLWANGNPAANAIVRICDLGLVTRTDESGHFRIASVSPGKFLVRAETPGGEFHSECDFEAGVPLTKDLTLEAVTTIGIRWVLQTKENSLTFSGDGIRKGEAYFSVRHSRFSFFRGAEAFDIRPGTLLYGDLFIATPSRGKEKSGVKPGTPTFHLRESLIEQMQIVGGTRRSYRPGLHRENARFEDITEVNGGKPLNEETDFENLDGVPIRAGDVYTLRCFKRDCYVKMEITDVTLVEKKP